MSRNNIIVMLITFAFTGYCMATGKASTLLLMSISALILPVLLIFGNVGKSAFCDKVALVMGFRTLMLPAVLFRGYAYAIGEASLGHVLISFAALFGMSVLFKKWQTCYEVEQRGLIYP